MSKTQSVILNINENYANNKPSDYKTAVSQKFSIGKNAEVALYNASLSRKPIYIDDYFTDSINFQKKNQDVAMDLFYYPSPFQLKESDAFGSIVYYDLLPELTGFQNFEFQIDKGEYTADQFSQRLSLNANTSLVRSYNGEIINSIGGNDYSIKNKAVLFTLPYQYIYDKDDFYLGLAGVNFTSDVTNTNFYEVTQKRLRSRVNSSQLFPVDNNEAKSSTGALLLDVLESNTDIDGIQKVTANAAINVSDYSSFARLSDSPVYPLLQNDNSDSIKGPYQNTMSYYEFNVSIADPLVNGDTDFVVGFTNTHAQSKWNDTDNPDIGVCQPSGLELPEVFLGARFTESVQGQTRVGTTMEIYGSSSLGETINVLGGALDILNYWDDDMTTFAQINLDNPIGMCGKIGFRFIAHKNFAGTADQLLRDKTNTTNTVDLGSPLIETVYSFQVYARNTDTGEHVLYDSAHHNFYIPADLFEDGFLFNCIDSGRVPGVEKTSLGMMPYLFVNKLAEGDGISNPKMNAIVVWDGTDYYYKPGVITYQYNLQNDSIRDVLNQGSGEQETFTVGANEPWAVKVKELNTQRYNPNAYPIFKKESGITKIYGDKEDYIIELNLPIESLHNRKNKAVSKANNDVGQTKTIIYKTGTITEGQIADIQGNIVTKNIEPNNLKWLTLNNSEPLNLNSLNVTIRRNKSNKLATELTDSSIEILIKSDK